MRVSPDPGTAGSAPGNADISELLASAAGEQEDGSQRQRAMRRASRAALSWDVAAADVIAAGLPLSTLPRVGPWLARVISVWVAENTTAPPAPPLRSGFMARADALRIVAGGQGWSSAIRCDLQMHTVSSDGHASLEAMTRRCLELGYSHMAVTDHSEGLRIAHGMDAATRAAQAAEVRELNNQLAAEGHQFRILHGIEMNVAPDGSGDTDPRVLAQLDIVLGAFHSKLRLSEDQTDRYIRALRNPAVDVLAHPRGRIYNHRLGLSARWDEVFEAAAELGVALEVDAYSDRQDLDLELLRLAARHEVWIAVDTDSHHPIDLDAMPLGIATLIEAGVPRERVINTLAHDELVEWVAARRARAAARAL
ncbi:MAG: PHP domain-containing protein [Candidatus Dormibacteraeota bacterium]|nr:PHP domain-containing protein [Candidatus Dormibacteraeota bacterium]